MNKKQFNFNTNDKTKKNHIVPQVYLRYFRKSQANDIYVYDIKRNSIFTSDISNVAAENKLYVIEDKSIDMYVSWEDYYTQNVDNNINHVFNEVLRNVNCITNIRPLNSEKLRVNLINIILHQMLRTHEKIDALDNQIISQDDYDLAYKVANELIAKIDGKINEIDKFTRKYFNILNN